MAQVEIGAKISVDASSAGKSINDLNEALKQSKSELNNAKLGSDEYHQAQQKVKQATDELNIAQKGSSTSFGTLKQKMGEMSPVAGQATESVGRFNGMLNVLKANPIIAILALLTAIILALVSKFKEMDGAADKMSDTWNELSGIMNKFINSILTPLIDGFVKLLGFVTSVAEAIADKLGIASKETSQRMGELAQKVRELDDAQKDQAISLAESNRKLAEAREKAGDANLPIKERISALREAGKIEKQELDNVVKINLAKTSALMEQMAMEMGAKTGLINKIKEGTAESLKAARAELLNMKNVNKDKLYELDQMIIAAEDAGTQSAKIAKKTNSAIASLEHQDSQDRAQRKKTKDDQKKKDDDAELARVKKLADDTNEILKRNEANRLTQDAHSEQLIQETRMALMKDGYTKRQQEIENARQKEIDNELNLLSKGLISQEQYNANRQAIDDKYNNQRLIAATDNAEKEKKIKEDNAAAQKKIEEDKFNAQVALMDQYGQALNGLADVVGKQTAFGKTLAVASALISTYEGIAKGVKLGFPAMIPAIAIASATGFSAVRNILKTKVPGGGGGGSAPSAESVSAPLLPRQAQSTTSLSGQTLSAMASQPARAYVVESDIGSAQQKQKRIERASVIG